MPMSGLTLDAALMQLDALKGLRVGLRVGPLVLATALLAACSSAPIRQQSSGPPPAPLPREVAADMVLTAMNFIGARYQRGGVDPEGFDCSGFTRHVVAQSLGVTLPRTAAEQAMAPGWQFVSSRHLEPGDLVFFNTLERSFSHVGLYIGEGRFIHAPRPGHRVRLEELHSSYWAPRFEGGRRAPINR
jgi:cell wall-associated NlpC family hydrolase